MKPIAECLLTALVVYSPILLCCFAGAILWAIRYARKNRRKKHKMTDKKKRGMTDEDVEREIDRLRKSEFVKIAKQEEQIRYARRNLLYNLRSLERKGRKLYEMGWRAEDADEAEYDVG